LRLNRECINLTVVILKHITIEENACLNDVVDVAGEEDSVSINWMFLYKGEAKRCQCGNWFKLVELDTSKQGGQQ